AQMPGKPFQGKLIPFTDQIKSWRRAGKTWQEVADNLADTKYLGYQMAPGPICRFMGRIKRRPYPLAAEPLTEPTPPSPAKPAKSPPEEPRPHSGENQGTGQTRGTLCPRA